LSAVKEDIYAIFVRVLSDRPPSDKFMDRLGQLGMFVKKIGGKHWSEQAEHEGNHG